jgi:membrane protein implicated in regulation of membrane protease activity
MSKKGPRAFLEIRAQPVVNAVLIILALPIAGFLLLMGIANLIQPDVSDKYLFMNTVMCLLVCAIGIGLLLMAVAAFRGILHNRRNSKEEGKT